jgi:hypothetical protein
MTNFPEQPALTAEQVAVIAAGAGDATAVRALQRGQFERLQQALETIIELSTPASTQAAATLLQQAYAHDAEMYVTALTYPHIMTWGVGNRGCAHYGVTRCRGA